MRTRTGLLASLILALSVGCSILPKDLVAHPSYETYDDAILQQGNNFFKYKNGVLNIEGVRYPVQEDGHEYYPAKKETLDKIFGFIDSKIKIEEGTDVFTSKHRISLALRGFYLGLSVDGKLKNDHIYIEPLYTDPFEINCSENKFYADELVAEIIGLYETALHEYSHQMDRRSNIDTEHPNTDLKRDLEKILTNDLGFVIEPDNPSYKTDINEIYQNMFKILFFIKQGNDFKAHLQNDYRFRVVTDEGTTETTLPDFNMDTVLELMIHGDFAHKEITPSMNPFTNGLLADKLAKIKEKAPELEKFYSWFRN